MRISCLISFISMFVVAATAPNPQTPSPHDLNRRQLSGGLLGGVLDGVDRAASALLGDLQQAVRRRDREGVLDILGKIKPVRNITNMDDAINAVTEVSKSKAPNLLEYQARLVANGVLTGTVSDLLNYAEGFVMGESGSNNNNPDPSKRVYPKIERCDAPYTQSESRLRSAIFIPKTFTYGKKPPVILFPGTGSNGYTAFQGNFIPLLSNVDWADPVWVNVPGLLLDDAQVNAEYAAYAMNYIASLTKRNVAIIAWSQGNINTQWAFKYWPSTRKVTNDHVAISADYKGTILANFADLTGLTNTPSVLQQEAGSNYIRTLRGGGGDSAYVPTTSVYSGFIDEIVQPQSGPFASAIIGDAGRIGASNSEAQVVCKGRIGGSLYTHEGMLSSSLAFALAKDALTHAGPGKVSRLNLASVCNSYLAPGLGLSDFLLTENAILIAALSVVLYVPKVADEPTIMRYTTAACR